MPLTIPVNATGERRIAVNTGDRTLLFRTYFVHGQDSHWLLDIADSQENPLITGINLTPGAANLLKGQGDTLEGCQLLLLTADDPAGEDPSLTEDLYKGTEAPGSTMWLVWYPPGESNPIGEGDPLDVVGPETWAIY